MPPHRQCLLPLAREMCDLGRGPPLWMQASRLLSLPQDIWVSHQRSGLALNIAQFLLSEDIPPTEPLLGTITCAKHLTGTFLTLTACFLF